jgi:hypothetical protein
VSSSVANDGLARAKESARQLDAGNWNQIATAKGIVLLRMRSSVVNSGFVRAEEGAQQLLEGNWGKAGGHRTLLGEAEGPYYPPAGRATCWKRWCCLCGGICTRQLAD